MTTPQPHGSSGSTSASTDDSSQYNPLPCTLRYLPLLPLLRFPSTVLDSGPAISPSSSSTSTTSLASSDPRERPSTPPPDPTKGIRLPRFSLWGRDTPDTLLSDSTNSLNLSSNIEAGLNRLHVGKQLADPLQSTTDAQHLIDQVGTSSEPTSPPVRVSGSATPMPALTLSRPSEPLEPFEPSPMSSPKLGSMRRLAGSVFASPTTPAANATPRKGRPQTADPSAPRDTTIALSATQFAAWSDLIQDPAPPQRSTTFSSVSSASAGGCSRLNIKKVRSQDSIRSTLSTRLADAEPSASSSTVPVPKAAKTKLRSKSKAGKEIDFERVFLSQEMYASASVSRAGSFGRVGSEAMSPSLTQTEFFTKPAQESRRKRSSWAPRRSTSPQAATDRRPSDLVPSPSGPIFSFAEHAAEAQPKHEEACQPPSKVNRQFSTSSRLTTTSTNGSDTMSPRSPTLPSGSDSGELMQLEDTKAKRAKAASSKHKTYALQFSLDGRYLAVAGSDHVIRVYEVIASPSERAEEIELAQMQRDEESSCKPRPHCRSTATKTSPRAGTPELAPVFRSAPVRVFAGHSGDVLDLSWSKNNFLLSCSTDKTAKLWHPNRGDCLCTFTTSAVVSSIDFHPTDDRFFITGGLDGKLRLWNIAARRMQSIIDVPGIITAVAFSSSGQVVCVGTHSGSMLTFSCLHALAYVNTVTVKSAAAGKSTPASKITSIQPIRLAGSSSSTPVKGGAAASSELEYMAVTSNDSRVRIYSLSSRRLVSRFKSASYLNRSSQIRATSSSDAQFIVSGSEDAAIHVWSLASNAPLLASLFAGIKRNKSIKPAKGGGSDVGDNSTWWSWQAGSGNVRCAVFAPDATNDLLALADDPLARTATATPTTKSRIIVSTDDSNTIKVWRTDPQGRLI